MKISIRKIIVTALLCVLTVFGFGGCKSQTSPLSGGTVDKSDLNAPKAINSKEIADFYATFYLKGEWSESKGNCQYTFEIKNNENGVLTAYEAATGVSFPADETLLSELQRIIDEHNLVSNNGVYRVTSGLPPEFQKCSVQVNYKSGEKLYFTKNNNPDAEWIKQVYLAFANRLADGGDASLLPPKHNGKVENITLRLRENGIYTDYGLITVSEDKAIDGETNLFSKRVYDDVKKESVSRDYAVLPNDYYDRVSEILASYDLRPFDSGSVLYGMGRTSADTDSESTDISLYITYDDGTSLNINASDETDKKLLKPLLDALCKYYDSVF